MTNKVLCATDLKSMPKKNLLYFLHVEKNKSFYRNPKKYALEEQVRLLKCPFWIRIDRDMVLQSFIDNSKILKPFWLVPSCFILNNIDMK